MVDCYSLQMFSLHTYSGFKKLPQGSRQIMSTVYNRNTGFLGKAYETESGEIVIAFRGTEIKDIIGRGIWNDIKMACKKLPPQLQNAFIMYQHVKKSYPNAKITLTGDSLGGTLAALVAAETGTKAVTFAAYGAKDLIDSPKYTSNIINIGDTKDPIFMANVNQHIGKVYIIPNEKGEVYMPFILNLPKHGIKSMGFLPDMKEYKVGTVKSYMDHVASFNSTVSNLILYKRVLKNKINNVCRNFSSVMSGHWVTIDGNHVFIEDKN